MINNRYVTPVGLTSELPNTEVPIPSPEELENMLRVKGVEVAIGQSLKGGTVSQVYEAQEGETPVVVKYTTDCYDTDPTVYTLPHEAHYVDTKVLKFLATQGVRVPRVLHDFSDTPLTVMEDMRASGFSLFNDVLMRGEVPLGAAQPVGHGIAALQQALGQHEVFETALSGPQNYYERGLELRLAYPNDQTDFKRLEKRFTAANQQLIAVDTHPKNMFVNAAGEVAWIDFGFSTWADRDFALPNCMAHFAIYALTGHVPKDDAADFIEKAVSAYRDVLPIDDEVTCTYLAAEVLHRWAGKWIGGVGTAEQKLKLLSFGMKVFDKKITTLPDLTALLRDTKSVA
jgi:hypothetical protein